MNLKLLLSVVLAISVGLLVGNTTIFAGEKFVDIINNSYQEIKNIDLNDLSSLMNSSTTSQTASRGTSSENQSYDLASQEPGPIFSDLVNSSDSDENKNSILMNLANKLKENFLNRVFTRNQKFSEDLSIHETGKVIVANLETMKIVLYEDGEVLETYNIQSKGRPGEAWETPLGSFEILYKTKNHFSSIAEVWMPYSMQFFGNFFIHGWPYYADGTEVRVGYSGGCIRLTNEDAKAVYEFASLNTKVQVLGTTAESISAEQKGEYKIGHRVFPDITAKALIVADIDSGDVIFSKNSDVVYPIASITKLMTSLISLETISQFQQATVSKSAYDTEGSLGDLKVGERILTGDLIYPLLLQSSNDASEVLAEFSGRNHFINNMNVRAKTLKLDQTSFVDPSGLSEKNISTAEDLFKLARYIYKYKNFIFEISRREESTKNKHSWSNTSPYAGSDFFLGGMGGFSDEARHAVVVLVEIPIASPDAEQVEPLRRRFAIILLQSENTEADTQNIMFHLQNNLKYTANL